MAAVGTLCCTGVAGVAGTRMAPLPGCHRGAVGTPVGILLIGKSGVNLKNKQNSGSLRNHKQQVFSFQNYNSVIGLSFFLYISFIYIHQS